MFLRQRQSWTLAVGSLRRFHVPRINNPPSLTNSSPLGVPRAPSEVRLGDTGFDPVLESMSKRGGLLDADDPSASWEKARVMAEASAAQSKEQAVDAKPTPRYVRLPALSARCVGRDHLLFEMWQRMHQGKRFIVLSGVDGIGKSCLAAAYGDHVRLSARFSCIFWIDGRYPIASQLHNLAKEVAGRKETRALLIFDAVDDIAAVVNLLPSSDEFAAVITTTKRVDKIFLSSSPQIQSQLHEVELTPPSLAAACEIFLDARAGLGPVSLLTPSAAASAVVNEPVLPPHVAPSTLSSPAATTAAAPAEHQTSINMRSAEGGVSKLVERLVCVPLLCVIAGSLLREEGGTPEAMVELLDHHAPVQDGGISISKTLSVLLNNIIARIERDVSGARSILTGLSLVNTEDLNPGLIDALYGADGATVMDLSVRYAIARAQWDSDAMALQQLVAKQLRGSSDENIASIAAFVASRLVTLWPRRWRGMGKEHAWSLSRHATALHESVTSRHIPITDEMVTVWDRAASFMAHIAGRDLAIAGELWYTIHSRYCEQGIDNAEAARVALDTLRILHRGCDHRAKEVGDRALKLAKANFGERSTEAAVVLLLLVKFMDFSEHTLLQLMQAADSVRRALNDETALSAENRTMYCETLFGLDVAIGKTLEALSRETPPTLWTELDALHEQLKSSAALKQAEQERLQRSSQHTAFDTAS